MATSHPSTCSSGTPETASALDRINADWQNLRRDPRATACVAAWSADHPEQFAGTCEVQDVVDRFLALHNAGDVAGHDTAFAVLLRRAATSGYDAEVAWRVAVRVLIPKSIKIARSQLRPGWAWDEVYSAVLSALFEVVRTYPLDRRPAKIFNNIALDTLALARRHLRAEGIEERVELQAVVACAPAGCAEFMPAAPLLPEEQAELVEVLVRAARLQLLVDDDPSLVAMPDLQGARVELLELVVWAVDCGVLAPSAGREITRYYKGAHVRQPVTTRAMGAEGARIRKRASRAVRALRDADIDGFLSEAA